MMNRKWIFLSIFLLLVTLIAEIAFASNPIMLFINGQEIKPDVPPQIINGRTMVPIRWVAEALGADVEWDGKNRQVKVNQLPDVWQDEVGFTSQEWIRIRNQVTRFIIAFDERDEAGRELVSSNFDSNLVGPEVVIPIGGFYPAVIDYKFIDARYEAGDLVRIRVRVYEKGLDGLIYQNWDFLVNTHSQLIEGLFADEKQPLNSHTVFPGLTIRNNH